MSLPSIPWLDETLVEDVLKTAEIDGSLKVTKISVKTATKPGDGHLSDMMRVAVEYTVGHSDHAEAKRKSLIIKISPAHSDQLARDLNAYETEIRATRTLGLMNELIKEQGFRLSPTVFGTEDGILSPYGRRTPAFIVMEDMNESGYRMADRFDGLDLEHCLVAVRGLARFHASSIALWEKKPEETTSFTIGIFHESRPDMVKTLFNQGVKAFGTQLKGWSELGHYAQVYSEKFIKLSEGCYEKAIECARPKANDFCVLSHGDCWVNNMLFRYDKEGKVVDNIFVDFQVPWWSSPVVDLINLATTSFSEDVDTNHISTVIEEYSKTLTTTMNRFGCKTKAPSLDDIKQLLSRHQFLELMYACVYLPLTIRKSNDTVVGSTEEMLHNMVVYTSNAYRSSRFRNGMLRRIPEWIANGLLDV